MNAPNLRIGIGYDLHRLCEGRRLLLGGVHIPFSMGLSGHSDADVLFHAICDGLLGACACGDIGVHFPDTDPRFKDMSGRQLAEGVCAIIHQKYILDIINIDLIVICDKPNLLEYRSKITSSIADILKIDKDKINLKAKTTEKTSMDTVSSYAVVLVDIQAKSE
jgi:2-C-methyl-D-erythritol 2,4-cyclodiphosphate synthase